MMSEDDKIKCAEGMYEFWREPGNALYLVKAGTRYTPEDIRLFYCELLQYYIEGKKNNGNI